MWTMSVPWNSLQHFLADLNWDFIGKTIACWTVVIFTTFDVALYVGVAFLYVTTFVRPQLKHWQSGEFYGICWSSDTDYQCSQMNNTRFFRAFEYGKLDFIVRSGLAPVWELVFVPLLQARLPDTSIVISGTIAKYRHPVPVFSLYKVVTKLICWNVNAKCIFLEQSLVTLSDNQVKAVSYTKLRYSSAKFIEKAVNFTPSPELPDHVAKYLQAHEEILPYQQGGFRNGTK